MVASLELPGTSACYAALASLRGGARLLALDAVGNRAVAIDVDTAPRILAEAALLPDMAQPWSATLVGDSGGETAWAVLGPSHRSVLDRLASGSPSAATPPAARVVRLTEADGVLTVAPLAELPNDFLPVHASLAGGAIWVSGVARMSERLRGLPRGVEGLAKAAAAIAAAPRLGLLARIDAATGEVTSPVRGMAVYTTTAGLGDGRPISALLRLRVRPFPPSIAVAYGIECEGRGFVHLRDLSWWTVVPPYALGEVAVP